MKKELICISCPMGCHLMAKYEEKKELIPEEIKISGNKCKRGVIYGKEELLAPKRVVTATCAITSKLMARIPVKSSDAIPREMINKLLNDLYKIKVNPPIAMGDIILEDFNETGVNITATRSLEN